MLIFVRLVPVGITKMVTHALLAPVVYRANTKQEQRAVAVVVLIHKRVKRAPVANRADTKQEHRVVAVAVLIHKRVRRASVAGRANTKQDSRVPVKPLPIHKVVILVQTVLRRILARSVNM